ncbi:outer membrane protein [Stakelama tenebrarum]|uniref:Porin family protein n=1 Tax=Stakelama tenebrarum TaxID=2711215 RepID=A0A6G6Y422_9SPHN|nr:outer membrane beta-barrel protein [Sphingosinithalassobacter tenebrarum]QIG79316.1 porin family protein [Sphingosinithalassobacter tenebrarum]
MKKYLAAPVLALLAVACPAFAQSEGGRTAEKQFNGPWVAAFAGIDVFTLQENNDSGTERDFLYGGSIGYDYATDSGLVIGVEAEYSKSQVSVSVPDLLFLGDEFRFESDGDIYAGARVGITSGPTLLYVKGGYVSSSTTFTYDDPAAPFVLEEDQTKSGFRVGLGAEYGKKTLFGRVEMRYQDLGEFEVFGTGIGYARTNTQIVLGLGARF